MPDLVLHHVEPRPIRIHLGNVGERSIEPHVIARAKFRKCSSPHCHTRSAAAMCAKSAPIDLLLASCRRMLTKRPISGGADST